MPEKNLILIKMGQNFTLKEGVDFLIINDAFFR
jgi:hypothetical protein